MWRRLGVRPAQGDADPYDTDPRYCVYNETFKSYTYTPAWVKKIVKEIGAVEKYRTFFGKEPRMKKVIPLPNQTSSRTEKGRSYMPHGKSA
jgi:hypothetical protein